MNRRITRRDFLNGASIGLVGAALMSSSTALAKAVRQASGASSDHYPPILTGIRGNHKGSFETSHALAWRGQKPSKYTDLNEEYDLVVVGGGISGLAAALFYQQINGAKSRILILDNHDDFGGHAKRNEFHKDGHMLLGAGGSGNFQDSRLYASETKQLITDLGFDLDELRTKMDPKWPLGNPALPMGMYTDRKHYGKDTIVNGSWLAAWHGYGNYQELIAALTIPDSEKEILIQFIEGSRPLAKPVPDTDVNKFLKTTSYKAFLTDYVGLQPATCRLLNPFMNVTYGVGVDSLSIYEGLKTGLPGASVLGEKATSALEETAHLQESDIIWMPDGNATLTRQMVRRLIPAVAPGSTIEDLITARFDYGKLDLPNHLVRLRLNSSAVNAVNNDDDSVSVSYVTAGQAYRVKSQHCILACNNGLIPHLCPELPEAQKENLLYGVKLPLLAVNVLVRSGRPFHEAGSQLHLCPTSPFKMVSSAPPVNLGNYKHDSNPDAPMVIYLLTSPTKENNGKQTARDLFRLARHNLYRTSFEEYEAQIREQLTGMFGATGFDADRDIEAITINRWSHGYAYHYMTLFDPEWAEGEAPHELGRKQFGRISIANSDSHARAYLNAAIEAAWRAVNEQLTT